MEKEVEEAFRKGFLRGVAECRKAVLEYRTDSWNHGMMERIADLLAKLAEEGK